MVELFRGKFIHASFYSDFLFLQASKILTEIAIGAIHDPFRLQKKQSERCHALFSSGSNQAIQQDAVKIAGGRNPGRKKSLTTTGTPLPVPLWRNRMGQGKTISAWKIIPGYGHGLNYPAVTDG
jgi:hypothetical protein